MRRDTEPGGPPVWFADSSKNTFVLKTVLYAVQTILGDSVVVSPCLLHLSLSLESLRLDLGLSLL